MSEVILFTREISAVPERLVKNGKPVFGIFKGCPKRLDIKGVKDPFVSFLGPRIFSNLRIKSSLMFMFSIGQYIGVVDFFDQKVFGYAEVLFWNKETKRKFSYRKLMGPRRRFIPHNMILGFCASFWKNRYIRISWDHARNRFSAVFNLKGDSSRPSASAAFRASYMDATMNETVSVTPFPTKRRCSATYFSTPLIHGSLSLGATNLSGAVNMPDSNGHSLLKVNRAYYNISYEGEFALLSGMVEVRKTVSVKDADGNETVETISSMKRVSLHLSGAGENQVDADRLNPNFISVDGNVTPLPSVRITHSAGFMREWIIQDFENMVDLTFTPSLNHVRDMSLLFLASNTRTIFGKFEGVLKTSENEVVVLRNFEGIVRSQTMRL